MSIAWMLVGLLVEMGIWLLIFCLALLVWSARVRHDDWMENR